MKAVLMDKMGSDLTVVNAARVSFSKKRDFLSLNSPEEVRAAREADDKLISYLAKHNHWTPFGHCSAQFHVKAPIFVARQLVKHQVGLVWNEVSRRYVDDEPEFWYPQVWRSRAVNKKQGSGSEEIETMMFHGIVESWTMPVSQGLVDLCDVALRTYKSMLSAGVAPEMARIVLPLNMYTEWYWTGSLAAFARVCKLRLDPHAQLETQMIAKDIDEAMAEEFPVSWKALMSNKVGE